MGVAFTSEERGALCALLAQQAGDVVLRTDRAGFILDTTTLDGDGAALIGPHIADLARDDHAPALVAAHRAAIASGVSPTPVEFAARSALSGGTWFSLLLQPVSTGAIAVLRDIAERKALEERLFAAEWGDALTGLSNRQAFLVMLRHLADAASGGTLALFEVDHFQSLNIRFGQQTGDEVLVVVADLLREMTGREDIVSRVGSDRFAVLMPARSPDAAARACDQIVNLLADIARTTPPGAVAITASAGLSPIGGNPDEALRQAELALFMARAGGGARLAREGNGRRLAGPWRAESIASFERAA